MKAYQHTQTANWILLLLIAMGCVPLAIGWFFSPRPVVHSAWIVLPVLVVVGMIFRKLTIEVSGDELRWYFGGRWIRKAVPLSDIASARVVRTNFFEGWGIHYSRFGWLYNVSGLDAVAITLKTGKRFCLGTNEPEKLVAQLTGASPAEA